MIFLSVSLLLICELVYVTAQCSLNYKDDFDSETRQPVFIMNGIFLAPNPKTCNIAVSAGQKISVGCPGNRNYVKLTGQIIPPMKKRREESMVVECISGKNFKANQLTFTLKQLSCEKQPDVAIQKTSRKCGKGTKGTIHKVGYNVQGTLYTSYEVCFDTDLLTTYYVKHDVYPHSCLTQDTKSQSFQSNGMFRKVPLKEVYVKKNQQDRFENIFGKSQTYINPNNKKQAFEKGHLASRADYTMAAELRATYQYINAAPQWQEVNMPCWSGLERVVRDYVKTKTGPVTVFTGTHGILSLPTPGSNPVDKSISLAAEAATRKDVIPVPLYFYKVVNEAGSKMVFVTINWNSFNSTKLSSLKFCNDPCQLEWTSKGSTGFCCTMNRFIAQVGYTPS